MNAAENLKTIRTLWDKQNERSNVAVLPGFGITMNCLVSSNPDWVKTAWLTDLQNFADTNSIALLVTTVNEISDSGLHESLLLVQAGKTPRLVGQIHDGPFSKGTGARPLVVDVPSARIGILTGHDAFFPEAVTALAKSGADLLVVSSAAGNRLHDDAEYYWDNDSLKALWKTLTNETLHVVASDWTGNGIIIRNQDYAIAAFKEVNAANPMATLDLDSNSVRNKYLNNYYSYDLQTLLSKELW